MANRLNNMSERGSLSGVSRAALSFLSIVLIVLTIPAVSVIPSELVLFQPGSYQRALANQQFYSRFAALLAQSITDSHNVLASPGLGQQAVSYLSQEDLTRFFGMVFPEIWVKAQSDGLLQNFGDYINFQRGDLVLVLDLTEVKTRLAGSEGQQIAAQVVESWPQCSADDVGKVLGLMLSGQLQGIPVCRPPDMVLPAFEQVVQTSLQGMAGTLPDQLDLAGPLTSTDAQPGISGPLVPHWWQIFRWYAILRWLFRLTPVFALAVLLWIVLLTIHSLPDLLGAAGQPLLVGGLIALILALLGAFIFNPLLVGVVSNAFPLLPGPFKGVLSGVMLEVGSRYALWSAFVGFAVAMSGLALLVAAWVFEPEPV